MAEIELLRGFKATDKATRGSTSSLLMEKFPRQVPIFGLVPLSLACGSGLRGPVLEMYKLWV